MKIVLAWWPASGTCCRIAGRNDKRILPVPEPGQRSAAVSQQTKLPGRRFVHGRAGRYRLAAIKITGIGSGSGR